MLLSAEQEAILVTMVSGKPALRTADWKKAIHSVNNKQLGDVGEIYVTKVLRDRGHDVRHVGGNNKGYDLSIEAFQDQLLKRRLLIEVKMCRDRTCVRDTWGSWQSNEAQRLLTFDCIIMINVNVGLRVHVIPIEAMRRSVYTHKNGSKFAVRFGITDDVGRKDVGLLCGGRRFNGAWQLIDDMARAA